MPSSLERLTVAADFVQPDDWHAIRVLTELRNSEYWRPLRPDEVVEPGDEWCAPTAEEQGEVDGVDYLQWSRTTEDDFGKSAGDMEMDGHPLIVRRSTETRAFEIDAARKTLMGLLDVIGISPNALKQNEYDRCVRLIAQDRGAREFRKLVTAILSFGDVSTEDFDAWRRYTPDEETPESMRYFERVYTELGGGDAPEIPPRPDDCGACEAIRQAGTSPPGLFHTCSRGVG